MFSPSHAAFPPQEVTCSHTPLLRERVNFWRSSGGGSIAGALTFPPAMSPSPYAPFTGAGRKLSTPHAEPDHGLLQAQLPEAHSPFSEQSSSVAQLLVEADADASAAASAASSAAASSSASAMSSTSQADLRTPCREPRCLALHGLRYKSAAALRECTVHTAGEGASASVVVLASLAPSRTACLGGLDASGSVLPGLQPRVNAIVVD